MPLTRSFKETIRERAQNDAAFRVELLKEALNTMLQGDMDTAKLVMRDYINATVGFSTLGEMVDKNPKSLMRMLSASGSPTAENLFAVIHSLQKQEGIELKVTA